MTPPPATPRAQHTRWTANNAALAAFIIATMLIIVSAPYWIGEIL